MKYYLHYYLFFFLIIFNSQAQSETQSDSINTSVFSKTLESGYLETKYFNFDLRYLVKYNQYEGFRTGIGGVTNSNVSDVIRFEGYTVYGFIDDAFKYSFGTGVRLAKKNEYMA